IPVGGEFRVNTTTTRQQSASAVAVDAADDFVVTWYSAGQDGNDNGVYAQAYRAGGAPDGNEFRVNTFTTGRSTRKWRWTPPATSWSSGRATSRTAAKPASTPSGIGWCSRPASPARPSTAG